VRGRRRRWAGGAIALAASGLVSAGMPAGAAAAGTFLRGFAENKFGANDPGERALWYDQSVRANSSLVRINVGWRGVARSEPAAPRDPADPAYDFSGIDAPVIDAVARDQSVILTVFEAPQFAIGPRESAEALRGTWKPDPAAFGDFAQAVAARYSGSFDHPSLGVLPRVQYFQAWNEPNLSEYLTPQYSKRKPFAPDHYRQMLNAFSEGVARSGNRKAQVVTGGTGPYGGEIGTTRARPLRFLRELMCLNGRLEADPCKNEAQFDILAHHPITLSGGPNRSAIHRDDAAMPDFHNVVTTLRAAERRKTIGGGGRHPAWATEFWWESDPPDPTQGVPIAKQARWLQQSLYSLWRQGAGAAVWLLLLDTGLGYDGFSGQQSGLFFGDGSEKPSFTAFRFPFVVDRISERTVKVWTIAPSTGSVEIQESRDGGFRTIDRLRVTDGVPEQTKIELNGGSRLRGLLAGEKSLTYGIGA
jgi:hypothetical protein